jgi:hypothetical protein
MGSAFLAKGGRRRAAWLLLFIAAGAAPALAELPFETPGEIPGLEVPLPGEGRHEIVIAEDGVAPAHLELQAGEPLAWRSTVAVPLRIAFDRGVAQNMVCTHIVNFALEGGSLRSQWLQPGDVASFCDLAPGRYAYTIEREGAPTASGSVVVHARTQARAY